MSVHEIIGIPRELDTSASLALDQEGILVSWNLNSASQPPDTSHQSVGLTGNLPNQVCRDLARVVVVLVRHLVVEILV